MRWKQKTQTFKCTFNLKKRGGGICMVYKSILKSLKINKCYCGENKAGRDHRSVFWAILLSTSHHNNPVNPASLWFNTAGVICRCRAGASARHHSPHPTTVTSLLYVHNHIGTIWSLVGTFWGLMADMAILTSLCLSQKHNTIELRCFTLLSYRYRW